ncbi:galactose-binding domain-containing protein [Reichenbachiella agariperforans]|uniref:galactose-binding domain-containing protein n=1 Tax=Reichenbachiella agariperforans TaxID=156994 RepID=UPI001C08D123|nr:PA14 domain-containing protein [Reichenbachiella agariperforans]MBU2914122.1 discoidin domain-containing protein [Reichenbachiella agariperforans]
MRRLQLLLLAVLLWSSTGLMAQTTVNSLTELQPYLEQDDVHVKLAPGDYTVTGADVANGVIGKRWTGSQYLGSTFNVFLFEGNNSTYDFTGVTIYIKTETAQSVGSIDFYEFRVLGSNNTIKNVTVVDDGDVDDKPTSRATSVVLDGANNKLVGCHFTVKGSYPYGYGDIFGKGGGPVISHNKRSACLVRGKSNLVKDCTFICRSYGHGIFFQGAVDPRVDGCYVEGELRSTDEVLAEEGTGSPADNVDFETVWGVNLKDITGNYYFSLQEDGIRSYNAGETIVDGIEYERGVTGATVTNSTVVKMRSGVTIGWASGYKYVENCTTLACEIGYWVGANTDVVNSRGDASIGSLLSEDVGRSNSNIELSLMDDYVTPVDGEVTAIYYAGSGHNVVLYDETTYLHDHVEVVVGGERLAHRFLSGSTAPPINFTATDIDFNNLTNYPMYLGPNSARVTGQSCGAITDDGTNNDVSDVDCATACVYEEGVTFPTYATSGINYEIYEGDFDAIPDLETMTPAKSGMVADMDISATDTLSQFVVAFDGTLEVSADGRYTFYVSSDDPTSLIVDGKEVVSYDGASGLLESSGEICLAEGFHSLEVVRVEKNSDQSFSVSYESDDVAKTTALDVFGNDFASIDNLAYLANATQPSTSDGGLAIRAVDGNTDGAFASNSVTHTYEETNAWWQVELRDTYPIGEINVYNRTDCCSDRLGTFTISVLNEQGQTLFCQYIEPLTEPSVTVDAEGVLGRVIRIEKTEVGILALAEVEVYEGTEVTHGGEFQLRKRDSDLYAIDGGAQETEAGHSVAMLKFSNHENMTWTELDREEGYYSYQKYGSELCLAGNDQDDLVLATCDESAESQQWFKIGGGEGHYRLQLKGTELVIDGGSGRFDGANIYLEALDYTSEAQQWKFEAADVDNLETDDEVLSTSASRQVSVYPNQVVDVLNVQFPTAVYSQFWIHDLNGRVVRQGQIADQAQQLSVDFRAMDEGMYILMLKGPNASDSFKIIR